PLAVVGRSSTDCNGSACALYFYNNIIAAMGAPHAPQSSFPASMPGSVFDDDLYSGVFTSVPSEPHGLSGNPMFVNPASLGVGRITAAGLKLFAGSPALGNGYNSGYLGSLDFFGNAISSTATPNRGAYGDPGL
ncbi:MAG TPA: hypothetical protein VGC42_26875, partial [Kofleriaceae bacterium]